MFQFSGLYPYYNHTRTSSFSVTPSLYHLLTSTSVQDTDLDDMGISLSLISTLTSKSVQVCIPTLLVVSFLHSKVRPTLPLYNVLKCFHYTRRIITNYKEGGSTTIPPSNYPSTHLFSSVVRLLSQVTPYDHREFDHNLYHPLFSVKSNPKQTKTK